MVYSQKIHDYKLRVFTLIVFVIKETKSHIVRYNSPFKAKGNHGYLPIQEVPFNPSVPVLWTLLFA